MLPKSLTQLASRQCILPKLSFALPTTHISKLYLRVNFNFSQFALPYILAQLAFKQCILPKPSFALPTTHISKLYLRVNFSFFQFALPYILTQLAFRQCILPKTSFALPKQPPQLIIHDLTTIITKLNHRNRYACFGIVSRSSNASKQAYCIFLVV